MDNFYFMKVFTFKLLKSKLKPVLIIDPKSSLLSLIFNFAFFKQIEKNYLMYLLITLRYLFSLYFESK